MAKVGIAIETKNARGKRLGVSGLRENAMVDHFRNSGSAYCDYRLPRYHRFQEDNTEAFLQAGQAKHLRAVIFLSQSGEWYISQPNYGSFKTQFTPDSVQPFTIRPVTDDSNFELGNRMA